VKNILKILVVDDHSLVREGLRQVLKGMDPQTEVLQAADCVTAFATVRNHPDLDLVLLDYHLPDVTGLDALAVLGEQHPDIPVLLLSGTASETIMRQALSGGAAGFITKSSLSDELIRAVQQVLAGDVYLPPELDTDFSPLQEEIEDKNVLTQRQTLVLRSLLDGHSNREIGELLHISEETVKTHITAILRYFGAQNRTQAVVAATRVGYKPLSDGITTDP